MKRSATEMQLGAHRNAILVNQCGSIAAIGILLVEQ